MSDEKTCFCDISKTYDACCGVFHSREHRPESAVALMRSRYSAYCLGLMDYLYETMHPKTRGELLENQEMDWQGLEVISHSLGGKSDKIGKVEFKAFYQVEGKIYDMHEFSKFKRHKGVWVYVDGAQFE